VHTRAVPITNQNWNRMFDKHTSKTRDIGLLIIRTGLGVGFIYYHGWGKLMGGMERWEGLGGSMERFGISFWPTFWGFMASFAESIGALFILLGIFTVPMSLLLAITMLVAWTGHIASGQGSPAHAFKNMLVALGLVFMGAGRYSLDALIARRRAAAEADETGRP